MARQDRVTRAQRRKAPPRGEPTQSGGTPAPSASGAPGRYAIQREMPCDPNDALRVYRNRGGGAKDIRVAVGAFTVNPAGRRIDSQCPVFLAILDDRTGQANPVFAAETAPGTVDVYDVNVPQLGTLLAFCVFRRGSRCRVHVEFL